MELQIRIGGQTHTIVVETDGNLFTVTSGGETWKADVARVDESTFSLIFPERGHASIEIGLAPAGTGGDFTVHLAGGVTPVTRLSGAARFGRRGGPAEQAVGTQQILAPMPGKIVRVLVKPGDDVKARQGVVVVEAMKMENELRSPKDGRVVEVSVTEGMSVESGRLLVTVE
jgi:biotin carboxyl carrier protein